MSRTAPFEHHKVSDLIDYSRGCWREALVKHVFLPCDAELIPSLALCESWPLDKLIWHYNPHGLFTVQSAYHMLVGDAYDDSGSSSSLVHKPWRALWRCNIPSRIKMFGWRACVGSLPTALNISSRIPGFSMAYGVCGHPEEMDTHALLECPIALPIWEGSGLDPNLWTTKYCTIGDCIIKVSDHLEQDFGDFLAVLWEC